LMLVRLRDPQCPPSPHEPHDVGLVLPLLRSLPPTYHSRFKIASTVLPTDWKPDATRVTRKLHIDSSPATRLARGGRPPPAPSAHRLADFEEFELADYAGIQDRRAKLAQCDARRTEKIRRLDEEDDMKFSHSIQFNAVPDWSSHYIAYSNLKKL
jgi:hypothetical protein